MTNALQPGDLIHFLGSMSVSTAPGQGRPVQRGVELEITQAIIDEAKDRNGNSWLDLVDDEQAQTAKWGAPRFGRGPVPEGIEWWQASEADRNLARKLEQENLKHFSDPAQRAAEKARIKRTYGLAATSWSLGSSGINDRDSH